MPFAADDSRFVPADPDKMLCSLSDVDELLSVVPADARCSSWNRLPLLVDDLLAAVELVCTGSSLPGIGDGLRCTRRWLDGTGSSENLATGSAIRTSGRVSWVPVDTCFPSADTQSSINSVKLRLSQPSQPSTHAHTRPKSSEQDVLMALMSFASESDEKSSRLFRNWITTFSMSCGP